MPVPLYIVLHSSSLAFLSLLLAHFIFGEAGVDNLVYTCRPLQYILYMKARTDVVYIYLHFPAPLQLILEDTDLKCCVTAMVWHTLSFHIFF